MIKRNVKLFCFIFFLFSTNILSHVYAFDTGDINIENAKLIRKSEGAKSDNREESLSESIRILDKVLHNRYYYQVEHWIEYDPTDPTEIEEYIYKIDKNFSIDCYRMEIKEILEEHKTLLTYFYYVDGVKTNIAYEVSIVNGDAKEIILYGMPVYPGSLKGISSFPVPEKEIKEYLIAQSDWTKDGFQATSQQVFYKYDGGTGRNGAAVITNYQHPETGYQTSESCFYFPEEEDGTGPEIQPIERRYLGGWEREMPPEEFAFGWWVDSLSLNAEPIQVNSNFIADGDFEVLNQMMTEYFGQNPDFFDILVREKPDNQTWNVAYYQYKIDDFGTNVCVEFLIDSDGYLQKVSAYGIPLYPDEQKPSLSFPISEEKIKAEALKKSQLMSCGFRVTSQFLFLKTEPETNRPCAMVLSNFESPLKFGGEEKRSEIYTYYLDGRVNK